MNDSMCLQKAYLLSIWLWAIGCAVSLVVQGWQSAIGWTMGCALSVATVRSLEAVVRRHFVPGNAQAKRNLLRAYAAKVPMILLLLIGAVLAGRDCLPLIAGFGAGILLVQTSIVLRTAAHVITDYAREKG